MTKYGHSKYQVIFFGLFNVLTSFQGYINTILAKKQDFFAIIYLDNVLININEIDYIDFVWEVYQ